MTKTYLPDFDVEVVETKNGFYKVIFEEENCAIYLDSERVQDVVLKASEEPEFVAVLIAYIEFIHRNTIDTNHRVRKISEKEIAETIVGLTKVLAIEEVIYKFKELKWHEIQKVVDSSNPIATLEKMV